MAYSRWNHFGITFQGQFCDFRSSPLHLIRHHIPVDVERCLDITVPHEFCCTVIAVPTASSQLRYVCRKLCVPSLPIPAAVEAPCSPIPGQEISMPPGSEDQTRRAA